MTSQPAHQRAWTWARWLLLGFLGAGAFLGAISNSIAIATWRVTLWGTCIVLAAWLTIEIAARYRLLTWVFGTHPTVIRAFGPRPRILMIGAVAVLWIPRAVEILGFSSAAAPEVQAIFFPKSAVLGKVVPHLSSDGSSSPVTIYVGMKNAGGRRASGAVMTISFRKGVDARAVEGQWKQTADLSGYSHFGFEDSALPLYARSDRYVGAFQVRLPKRTDRREILAWFELHGDFVRKEGLLYYDRAADEYQAWHTATLNEASLVWNAHVTAWNQAQ
jgi:hypothetical protein